MSEVREAGSGPSLPGKPPLEANGDVSPRPTFPSDPLHGVKLETIINALVERHGWAEMGKRIPVRCFQFNPSVKSSLTFLRKTSWARQRVEGWYLDDLFNQSRG